MRYWKMNEKCYISFIKEESQETFLSFLCNKIFEIYIFHQSWEIEPQLLQREGVLRNRLNLVRFVRTKTPMQRLLDTFCLRNSDRYTVHIWAEVACQSSGHWQSRCWKSDGRDAPVPARMQPRQDFMLELCPAARNSRRKSGGGHWLPRWARGWAECWCLNL